MQTQENLSRLKIIVDSDLCLQHVDFGYSKDLYALVSKSRATLKRWLPWVEHIGSQDDFSQLIQYYLNKNRNTGTITMCISYKHQAAGIIGFNYIDWQNRSGALGYWLGSEFQGKGIMLASCKQMLRYGFSELQLHKINILCATGNHASRRIPERLHFRQEGLLRDGEWLNGHYEDLYSYAMLASEWPHAHSEA